MRTPTPINIAYAWYNAAMTGNDCETTDEPQCGWFKRKLVRGGPFVPARIWLDREIDDDGNLISDEVMLCEVMGNRVDPEDQWIWLFGNPISKSEFDYLTASIAWSVQHAPDEPRANPRQPIDWLRVPTPSFNSGEST